MRSGIVSCDRAPHQDGPRSSLRRRLPAVAEVVVPFYEGLDIGVPSLPLIGEPLAEGRYELIHIASPGPAGIAADLIDDGYDGLLTAPVALEVRAGSGDPDPPHVPRSRVGKVGACDGA